MTQEKIIERVKKLLALAGDNPNEHEREAAMAKALGILAEHNLTMEEVNGPDISDQPSTLRVLGRSGPWVRQIYTGIARMYFCEHVYISMGKKTAHIIVGRPGDAAVAHEMAHWISERLWSEGLAYKRDHYGDNSYLTSFLNSAAVVLNLRIATIIEQAKKGEAVDPTGNTLPVLASQYDQAQERNEKWLEDQGVKKKANNMSATNPMAAMAGMQAAEKIQLNQQVGGPDANAERIE